MKMLILPLLILVSAVCQAQTQSDFRCDDKSLYSRISLTPIYQFSRAENCVSAVKAANKGFICADVTLFVASAVESLGTFLNHEDCQATVNAAR